MADNNPEAAPADAPMPPATDADPYAGMSAAEKKKAKKKAKRARAKANKAKKAADDATAAAGSGGGGGGDGGEGGKPGKADRPADTDTDISAKWASTNEPGRAFLAQKVADAASDPSIKTTASGLVYRVVKSGPPDGASPGPTDKCVCHYAGTLAADGTEFDSSIARGKPSTFAPNQVIGGWTEALQLMRPGDEWELYICAALGYGAKGAGGKIPPGACLVFTLQFIEIQRPTCATEGCGKPGTLFCPTCKKLGLPPAPFCSQACFKANWPQHKWIHKLVKNSLQKQAAGGGGTTADGRAAVDASVPEAERMAMPPHFRNYGSRFTGPLRPCRVSPMRGMPGAIAAPDYARRSDGLPLGEQEDKRRRRKGAIDTKLPSELTLMREACRLGRACLDMAGKMVAVGVTGEDIDVAVHNWCVDHDCYPSPLNYHKFPKALCTSVNEVICHGIPDARPLVDGDIVNLDITVFYKGYHADLNETFLVGNVDDAGVALVRNAYECLRAAVLQVRPGTMYRDLGKHIAKVATKAGHQVTKDYCGHGIGRLFHTSPNVPHYKKNKAIGIMKPGHTFTIEPMINAGTWASSLWPDDWTAVTRDGKRSAQFEHTMVVTATGVELLTAREGTDATTMPEWNREWFQR